MQTQLTSDVCSTLVILLFLFVSETGSHSAGLAGLGNDVNQDDLELTEKPLPPKY